MKRFYYRDEELNGDQRVFDEGFKCGYQKGYRAGKKAKKPYWKPSKADYAVVNEAIRQTGLDRAQSPSYTGHVTNKYTISPLKQAYNKGYQKGLNEMIDKMVGK